MTALSSGKRNWAAITLAVCIGYSGDAFSATPALATKAGADLTGVWQVTSSVRELKTVDGKEPPLLPAAKQLYDERRAQLKRGDASFDPTLRCKPMGQPRIMYDSSDYPFDIVQSGKKLFFGYTWNRQPRYVYVDEAMPAPTPVFYGYSGARWEGDALVVRVEGLDDSTLLDASGMPHGDELVLTERYRLKQRGQQLEVRYTFDDPATFARSWDAVLTFRRVPNGRIAEDICVERRALFK